MRLISTATYEIREFIGASIPQYVILSHTWRSDEVTLKDMQSGTATGKRGFKKIEFTCAQAVRDNFAWAWVDTCCIDKASSAELSEAINSMYIWYRDSCICYVYLDDATGFLDPLCKWFTRGWTLQELLAPESVEFFDANWEELGNKAILAYELGRITGISPPLLTRVLSLQHFSVAQKFFWAAKRQTTRVEDRAYSLLGLFGVHMPLLYGEGDKAFQRLQKEIIQTSTDPSIYAWSRPVQKDRDAESCGLLAESLDSFGHIQNICPIGLEGKPSVPIMRPDRTVVHMHVRPGSTKERAIAYLDCEILGKPDSHLCLALFLHVDSGPGKRNTYYRH